MFCFVFLNFIPAHLLRGLGKERLAALSRTSRVQRPTARSSPRRRGRCLQDNWIPRNWPRRFWRRPRATCKLWRACRKRTLEQRHWGGLRGEKRHRPGSLLCLPPQPQLWLPLEVLEGFSPLKPVRLADHPVEQVLGLAPLLFPSLVIFHPSPPLFQHLPQLGLNRHPAPHHCRKSALATTAQLIRLPLYLSLWRSRVHLSPRVPQMCICRLSSNSNTLPHLTPPTSRLPILLLTAPHRRPFRIPPRDPFQPPPALLTPLSWTSQNRTKSRQFII